MKDTPRGAQLLGEAVLERRRFRQWRQRDVAQAGGPSVAVLRNIEHGLRDRPHRSTLTGLDRALGWPAGAAKAVFLGSGPPWPASTATDPRVYIEELIVGKFPPIIESSNEDIGELRNFPTPLIVAHIAPWLTELIRRCDADPTLLVGLTGPDHRLRYPVPAASDAPPDDEPVGDDEPIDEPAEEPATDTVHPETSTMDGAVELDEAM